MEKWAFLKACLLTYRSLYIVYKLSPISDTVIVILLFFDQGYKDVLHLKESVFEQQEVVMRREEAAKCEV